MNRYYGAERGAAVSRGGKRRDRRPRKGGLSQMEGEVVCGDYQGAQGGKTPSDASFSIKFHVGGGNRRLQRPSVDHCPVSRWGGKEQEMQ